MDDFLSQFENKPPISNCWVAILLSIYIGSLLTVLLTATKSSFQFSYMAFSIPLALIAFSFALLVRHSGSAGDAWKYHKKNILGGILVVFFVGFYLLGIFIFSLTSYWPGISLVYGILSANVFGLLGESFIPANQGEELSIEYLEYHSSNWWRFTQLISSIHIAIGIGIAVSNNNVERLWLLVGFAAIGGLVIILYVLTKFNSIEEKIWELSQ